MQTTDEPAVFCEGLSKSFDDERVVSDLELRDRRGQHRRADRAERLRQDDDRPAARRVARADRRARRRSGARRRRGCRRRSASGSATCRRSRRCSPTSRCGRTSASTPRCTGCGCADATACARCWSGSSSTSTATRRCARCRAACSGGSRWPRRSCTTRRWCSSTSRRRASTRSCAARSGSSSGRCATRARTMCVTTQYVGEAAYCDYVGLLSDGELLMIDTPENLRKAAFDGEVVDIELSREVDAVGAGRAVTDRWRPVRARTRSRRGCGGWSSTTPTTAIDGWTTSWSGCNCRSSRRASTSSTSTRRSSG